jgi:tyrosyl-tRNA synthetase
MSSSAPADTKIMFSDSASTVQEKIAGGDLPTGTDLAGNGIMAMFEHIVFPFRALGLSTDPCVEIRLARGLAKRYGDYDSLKEDVANGLVDTGDLQSVLAGELNSIMEPVREEYAASPKWCLAEQLGYDTVDMENMQM